MAGRRNHRMSSLLVRDDQPLIGVMTEERGRAVVRYFTEGKAADATISKSSTQAALKVIGAWRDLDWEEMVSTLDRIRHESQPTPPITNL